MSKTQECASCRKPKANLVCGVCQEPVCKDCEQYLEPETFSFKKKVPAELSHLHYCGRCFDEHIVPAQEALEATMALAREVYIFFDTQKRKPRLLSKAKLPVTVKDVPDRDEAILRLAFLAAEDGFNAILDVNVKSEKVRNEGWQKMRWSGSGLPVGVDAIKIERDFD